MTKNKIRFCIAAIFCLMCCISCAAHAAEGPSIEPAPGSWIMPDVKNGKKTQGYFVLKNTGGEELVIKEARACCGFNVVDISSWAIRPHSESGIIIGFDASNKIPGKYKKEVTIISNDLYAPELKVPVYIRVLAQTGPDIRPVIAPPVVKTGQTINITGQELYSRMSKGEGITLIDVREAPEFSEKYIQGALNFPKSKFKSSQEGVEALFSGVDKNAVSVVYCGGGFRSNYIAKKLRQYGWNSFNLEGGIGSWEKQGYPVITGVKIPPESEPLFIDMEEAYENYFILFKGSVIWVDVRAREEFETGHVAGAVNIPLSVLNYYFDFIPKDKEVVLYCQGVDCDEALSAGRQLIANGFKQARIKVFREGFEGWANTGYPTGRVL